MSFTAPQTWRMRAVAALAALLLASIGALMSAPRAAAHDQVVNQSPGAAEQMAQAPSEITLTFSGELLDLGNEIQVLNPEGTNVSQGAPTLSGFNIIQPVEASLEDGLYEVRWRVVSSDGHPISESYTFSIGDVAPTPSAAANLTAPAVPEQSAAPDAPSVQGASDAASDGGADLTWLWIVLGAGAGLLIYAVIAMALRARQASKN